MKLSTKLPPGLINLMTTAFVFPCNAPNAPYALSVGVSEVTLRMERRQPSRSAGVAARLRAERRFVEGEKGQEV